MKRTNPEQAIKKECRWCMNGYASICRDAGCPLKDKGLPRHERIRQYCLRCVPEQSMKGVRQCKGEVLYPEFHICSLHPFRTGQ